MASHTVTVRALFALGELDDYGNDDADSDDDALLLSREFKDCHLPLGNGF